MHFMCILRTLVVPCSEKKGVGNNFSGGNLRAVPLERSSDQIKGDRNFSVDEIAAIYKPFISR